LRNWCASPKACTCQNHFPSSRKEVVRDAGPIDKQISQARVESLKSFNSHYRAVTHKPRQQSRRACHCWRRSAILRSMSGRARLKHQRSAIIGRFLNISSAPCSSEPNGIVIAGTAAVPSRVTRNLLNCWVQLSLRISRHLSSEIGTRSCAHTQVNMWPTWQRNICAQLSRLSLKTFRSAFRQCPRERAADGQGGLRRY
jgi:hypothetical protein